MQLKTTTVKVWVWVTGTQPPWPTLIIFLSCVCAVGLPDVGTYITPFPNQAGCVITTNGVFSFLLPYRKPTALPHLLKARRHLPNAVRLQPTHYIIWLLIGITLLEKKKKTNADSVNTTGMD